MWDRDLMAARPWCWLRSLILALCAADTRTARRLIERHKEQADALSASPLFDPDDD